MSLYLCRECEKLTNQLNCPVCGNKTLIVAAKTTSKEDIGKIVERDVQENWIIFKDLEDNLC